MVSLLSCMPDNVVGIFPTVMWVGLQCVIVAFPGHTRLHLD